MRTNLLFAAASMLVAGSNVLSQQPLCRSTVLVTVLDQRTNQPIDGLTASDFHAAIKGRAISIRTVSPPPAKRRYVFVLDRSASMTMPCDTCGLPKQLRDPNSLVMALLRDSLLAIPNGDAVAFRAFAGQYSRQTEFMEPTAALGQVAEILSWKPEGKGDTRRTPLWDNVDSALRMLSPPKIGDLIVVISDGGDTVSKLHYDQIRKELIESEVPMLAIAVAHPTAPTPEERRGPQDLVDLAETTGAPATSIPGGLAPRILIAPLSHQYSLELEMPAGQKPVTWKLEIRNLAPERKTSLFYPQYLLPCGTMQ